MHLRCTGFGVRFWSAAGEVQALSDITFETREGEFVAIVGPSGVGKTTLLRTLAGLITPQQGTVARISAPGENQRALMMFQENNLFPWMTVLENAAFGLEMSGVGKTERHARARELLQRTGLPGWDHYYPAQLSLGMKQRVAVVRMFLTILPYCSWTSPSARWMSRHALRPPGRIAGSMEQSQRSVVFVTHDVEEAILLSDRVLVLGIARNAGGSFPVTFRRPRHVSLTLGEEFLFLKRQIWAEIGLPDRLGVPA